MAPVRPPQVELLPSPHISGSAWCPAGCGEPRSRCAAPDDLLEDLAGHLRPGLDGATRSPSWDSGCGPVAAQPHHPLAAMMLLSRLVTDHL